MARIPSEINVRPTVKFRNGWRTIFIQQNVFNLMVFFNPLPDIRIISCNCKAGCTEGCGCQDQADPANKCADLWSGIEQQTRAE